MPTERGDDPRPIDVTQPSDLPSVDLDPITPVPVEIDQPSPPDVSTGFFEELWYGIRKTVKTFAQSGGIDLRALIRVPDTIYKILIVAAICLVLLIPSVLVLRGCL